MDNYSEQMPPVQPVVAASPAQPVAAQPATPTKDTGNLAKTIVIVILSLISVAFIGLFIWMFLQYNEARTDVDGQINAAVATAVDKKSKELENEFAAREKYPYETFAGPEDYGQLSFEYPKTWSVYIASDASKSGDFEAYFNPGEVSPVSESSINALRVTIRNKNYDDVVAEYQKAMDRKDSNLSVSSVTFNNIPANRYTGTIPNTDLSGYIVIFKIRDKTAILRTDSLLFEDDFNQLLNTVTFNS